MGMGRENALNAASLKGSKHSQNVASEVPARSGGQKVSTSKIAVENVVNNSTTADTVFSTKIDEVGPSKSNDINLLSQSATELTEKRLYEKLLRGKTMNQMAMEYELNGEGIDDFDRFDPSSPRFFQKRISPMLGHKVVGSLV